jgi:hypothetical protein
VFTSRRHLESAPYPWTVVALDELAQPDAVALLRHEGSVRGLHDVVEADDDQLRPIYCVVGGNPLALKLVVGQLAALPLDRVLSGLEAAQPRTDAFYDYLFGTSWNLLSPLACKLLRHLASLPVEGATWQDLSAGSGLPDEALVTAVAELASYSLLQSAGLVEKVYTLHPLTRHFVARQDAVG